MSAKKRRKGGHEEGRFQKKGKGRKGDDGLRRWLLASPGQEVRDEERAPRVHELLVFGRHLLHRPHHHARQHRGWNRCSPSAVARS